jgi:hypothetical protein
MPTPPKKPATKPGRYDGFTTPGPDRHLSGRGVDAAPAQRDSDYPGMLFGYDWE